MQILAFKRTHIISLTFEGARNVFLLIARPVIGNTRSDGALLAVIARTIRSSLTNRKNVQASLQHLEFRFSMPGFDRHLNF